jgi:hypothetical protein
VDVFLQPAEGGPVAEKILGLLEGETAFAVATVVGGVRAVGRSAVLGAEGVLAGSLDDPALDRETVARARELLARRDSKLEGAGGRLRSLRRGPRPPPHLVLFGAGDDAIPLCAFASEAGFRVTVADHRSAYVTRDRFPAAARLIVGRPGEGSGRIPLTPRTYAVVKMHSFATTESGLAFFLPPAFRTWECSDLERAPWRSCARSGSRRTAACTGRSASTSGRRVRSRSRSRFSRRSSPPTSSREPWPLREKEGAIHAF